MYALSMWTEGSLWLLIRGGQERSWMSWRRCLESLRIPSGIPAMLIMCVTDRGGFAADSLSFQVSLHSPLKIVLPEELIHFLCQGKVASCFVNFQDKGKVRHLWVNLWRV